MGSGEFGGGGSVRWQVRYENHEDVPNDPPTGGHTVRGKGKDKGAQTNSGDKMYVVCKGQLLQNTGGVVIVEVTLANDKDQVVLTWGDEALTPPRAV